jgi:hypothetical protein
VRDVGGVGPVEQGPVEQEGADPLGPRELGPLLGPVRDGAAQETGGGAELALDVVAAPAATAASSTIAFARSALPVARRGPGQPVVRAGEVDGLGAGPQRADQRDRLDQRVDRLAGGAPPR